LLSANPAPSRTTVQLTSSRPATRCAFHRDRDAAALLNVLYENLVTEGCLGRSQFVGRSGDPSSYGPLLDTFGVPALDPMRRLRAALGSRGADSATHLE
jgi:hypothetical protein